MDLKQLRIDTVQLPGRLRQLLVENIHCMDGETIHAVAAAIAAAERHASSTEQTIWDVRLHQPEATE